jgi:polyisoprenoid-binding protein YceI
LDMTKSYRPVIVFAAALGLAVWITPETSAERSSAQAPAAQQGSAAPAPPPMTASKGAVKLDLTEGSKLRYRVREQLAGISFPNDAVGETDSLKGSILIKADGTIDATQSKLTADLRTFKSDQERRDGYLQQRTLETEKFPMAEFVAKKAEGLPHPLPMGQQAQVGFKLIGDLTLHGVTKEIVWQLVATLPEAKVSGAARTSFPFETFSLTKPSLARLLSVDDTINLEIEFRATRTEM